MFTSILQPTHLLVIMIVALVFLGPKRLPEAGRALGQGLKEFKRSIGGAHESDPKPVAIPVVTDDESPQRGPAPR